MARSIKEKLVAPSGNARTTRRHPKKSQAAVPNGSNAKSDGALTEWVLVSVEMFAPIDGARDGNESPVSTEYTEYESHEDSDAGSSESSIDSSLSDIEDARPMLSKRHREDSPEKDRIEFMERKSQIEHTRKDSCIDQVNVTPGTESDQSLQIPSRFANPWDQSNIHRYSSPTKDKGGPSTSWIASDVDRKSQLPTDGQHIQQANTNAVEGYLSDAWGMNVAALSLCIGQGPLQPGEDLYTLHPNDEELIEISQSHALESVLRATSNASRSSALEMCKYEAKGCKFTYPSAEECDEHLGKEHANQKVAELPTIPIEWTDRLAKTGTCGLAGCPVKYDDHEQLARHWRDCHPLSTRIFGTSCGIWVCPTCPHLGGFMRLKDLRGHVEAVHPESVKAFWGYQCMWGCAHAVNLDLEATEEHIKREHALIRLREGYPVEV